MKTDTSIRNICIAAIKRSTIRPFDFPLTSFFETGSFEQIPDNFLNSCNIDENELPIAQVTITVDTFTLVTTRQIISCNNGIVTATPADEVQIESYGDFKGYEKKPFTTGCLRLREKQRFEVFIETGKASMVMIKAMTTLIGLHKNKS